MSRTKVQRWENRELSSKNTIQSMFHVDLAYWLAKHERSFKHASLLMVSVSGPMH